MITRRSIMLLGALAPALAALSEIPTSTAEVGCPEDGPGPLRTKILHERIHGYFYVTARFYDPASRFGGHADRPFLKRGVAVKFAEEAIFKLRDRHGEAAAVAFLYRVAGYLASIVHTCDVIPPGGDNPLISTDDLPESLRLATP